MDIADDELRATIRMIWPLQADKMTDLLVPRREKSNKRTLTVGKIYAGILILESWRTSRFGRTSHHLGVSDIFSHVNVFFVEGFLIFLISFHFHRNKVTEIKWFKCSSR